MSEQRRTVLLDRQGVDDAAGIIEDWLGKAKVKRADVLRIRLTMEELLSRLIASEGAPREAELRFRTGPGACRLCIRYGGERFDPTIHADSGLEELSDFILNRTGFLPAWRWARGRNELRLRIPAGGIRPEILMLGTIALAVVVGLLGGVIPETVKAGVTDYALQFLADGFWNLPDKDTLRKKM